MPFYKYACEECGHTFEIMQKISDEQVTTCPECGGQVKRVFGNVGVVFKGSGFYSTDSKKKAPAKS